MKLCECGCGNAIVPKRTHGMKGCRGGRYLQGHSSRGRSNRYIPKSDEIPSGICECGCGLPTPICTDAVTHRSKRHFPGHPYPFRRGHSPKRTREKHWNWKGGRCEWHGYILILAPEHPSNVAGYVLEHRLVMEGVLGRLLRDDEVVHHINEIKADNRPENLEVLTPTEHGKHHTPKGTMFGINATRKRSA